MRQSARNKRVAEGREVAAQSQRAGAGAGAASGVLHSSLPDQWA
jgi:hypothetical protein